MFSLRFRYCVLGVIAFMAARAALVSADPPDDIKAGLQKLADAQNYSWTTKIENANGGGFGSGTTDGKAQQDGLTYVHMNRRNTDFEIYIEGQKIAVKGQDGTWQSLDDAANADDGNGGPNPMRFMSMMLRNFKSPIQQAKDQADKLTNIQKTDNGYSADLSPDAAKAVLNPFAGRPATTNPDDNNNAPQIDVSDAKASVTFSIQDGAVTKIVMHVTGSISFNGGDPRDVDRTTTTDFSNVGSTTIDVPDDAKAKLGA